MNLIISLSILCFFSLCPISAILFDNLNVYDYNAYRYNYNKLNIDKMEEMQRSEIFEENLKLIREHNKLYARGKMTYKMGINQFTDWTPEETNKLFVSPSRQFNGDTENLEYEEKHQYLKDKYTFASEDKRPDSMNWVEKGAVTSVKDQNGCKCGWAFAAAGAIEGQYQREGGKLVDFSVQQLVDCVSGASCDSGDIIDALNYVRANGITFEKDYEYVAAKDDCHSQTPHAYVNETFYTAGEVILRRLVDEIGPIAVKIDASLMRFRSYKSGVFFSNDCTYEPNHGVLVVGYGSYYGIDYWLVKNSWGVGWGEKGYVKMARNANPNCNIAKYVTFATVPAAACVTYIYNKILFIFSFFIISVFYF